MASKHRPRRKHKLGTPITAHTSGPPNSIGLASVPPELLLEIINYLPRFPIPCAFMESPMRTATHTRQAAIMALVQLCRSFRRALIHCLWEEIILCSLHGGQTNIVGDPNHICAFERRGYCHTCERHLAFEIVAQLETVTIRVPEYAARVQTLTVFLPRYSEKTVVSEFARCLTLLPNLKTLQLHYSLHQNALDRIISNVFYRFQYGHVETLVIPGQTGSEHILKACPNVRHLSFTSELSRGLDAYPNIEKFTGVLPYSHYFRVHRSMPNLKFVQVRTWTNRQNRSLAIVPAEIRMAELDQLSKLEVIEIALVRPEAREEAEELQRAAHSLVARMPMVSGIRRRVEVCDYTTGYK
ncbi:hypothetical protein BDN72DRAFT_848994 [Pluteus cervinus]|uniref:Uncharacterized protein n=1 Tax=Pluteus cervinus TaxID=181527 RepID=A0ACD3A943_9AGAR|nr:hypothetical protein BDN72DRAFT_848994 [Pluteus cervinus]